MGREIRRVPPPDVWEHPKYLPNESLHVTVHKLSGQYKPVQDIPYSQARREWLEGLAAWEAGTAEGRASEYARNADGRIKDYWEWAGNPPDRAYYLSDWPEGSATWWQLYETVSEGTPLSPPFATADELADWLSTHANYWGEGPMSRASAARLVEGGWLPSMVIHDGGFTSGVAVADVLYPEGGSA